MPARIEENSSGLQLDTLSSDPTFKKLQDASFDPVEFLNASLPSSLFSSAPESGSKQPKSIQIQEASSKLQELLGKLHTQNLRYSNILTQLTDEILRSGSRLAYEVEVLRGDANGLHELLTDTLQDDIQKLVLNAPEAGTDALAADRNGAAEPEQSTHQPEGEIKQDQEPELIPKLRMLSQVKARLEEVINVFGEAMEWPLPPSEVSITSSLISVSAPDPASENHTSGERAGEVAKKVQTEIRSLLDSDGGGYEGLDAADVRVESLRSLMEIWKGTTEEKARGKFVDSLAKLVDERRRALEARTSLTRPRGNSSLNRSSSIPARPSIGQLRGERNVTEGSHPAGGLLRNLQRLRDEIYLD